MPQASGAVDVKPPSFYGAPYPSLLETAVKGSVTITYDTCDNNGK